MSLPVKKPPLQTKKFKKFSAKRIYILVLLAVIVGAVGFILYQNYQDKRASDRAFEADKARFAQVEKDMGVAYGRIQSDVGIPSADGYGKSCSYSSAKFSEGTLTCGVYRQFSYGKSGSSNVVSDLDNIKNAVANSGRYTINSLSQNSDFEPGSDDEAVIYLESQIKDIRCVIRSIDGNRKTTYDFRCEGIASKSIYTLAE